MRKNILTLLFCFGVLFISNLQSKAQTLMHYWHFNNYNYGPMYTPTITAIPADYSIHSTSNVNILYTKLPGVSAAFSSYVDTVSAITADYDTMNLQMSAVPGLMLRARDPADSMQLLFYIPTVHYNNIVLKYGTESTSNGAQTQNFAYSLDSGVTFITTGLSATTYNIPTPHLFSLVTVNFPSTAADNSKLVFRVTFTNGAGLADSSGNNRFDNVTVQGDSITTAVAYLNQTVLITDYTLYPNPVINELKINSNTEGSKSVTIINELGQTVYVGIGFGKNFTINTSNLTTGSYYITVRDSNTNSVSTLKFIKQ